MSTLTLTVSPDVAALYERNEEARRRLEAFAVSLVNADQSYVPTPEDMASIGRGLAQADAGELIDGDAVIAEMFAEEGLSNPPTFNAGNPRNALRQSGRAA